MDFIASCDQHRTKKEEKEAVGTGCPLNMRTNWTSTFIGDTCEIVHKNGDPWNCGINRRGCDNILKRYTQGFTKIR